MDLSALRSFHTAVLKSGKNSSVVFECFKFHTIKFSCIKLSLIFFYLQPFCLKICEKLSFSRLIRHLNCLLFMNVHYISLLCSRVKLLFQYLYACIKRYCYAEKIFKRENSGAINYFYDQTTFWAEKVLCGLWWAIFKAIIRILLFYYHSKITATKYESEAYKVRGENLIEQSLKRLEVSYNIKFYLSFNGHFKQQHSFLLTKLFSDFWIEISHKTTRHTFPLRRQHYFENFSHVNHYRLKKHTSRLIGLLKMTQCGKSVKYECFKKQIV